MNSIARGSDSKSKCHSRHTRVAPSPWLSRAIFSKAGSSDLAADFEDPPAKVAGTVLMQAGPNAHEAVEVAEHVAKAKFGWPRLKEFQSKAVTAWASGQHSFVIAGTGRGKSACFQFPAVVGWELAKRNGTARPIVLVISPLVALMRDQVEKLRACGISAVVLGGQAREDDPFALERAMQGEIAVAYMSPEFAVGQIDVLRRMPHVSMLAIDEAHTIFEWGQTFRFEYNSLHKVHEALCFGARQRGEGTRIPIMCLTATCTPEIREYVLASLRIHQSEATVIVGTSNRQNLMYTVCEVSGKDEMRSSLLRLLTTHHDHSKGMIQPSIIYTRKRLDCSELSHFLVTRGIKAVGYHGGMADHAKSEKQQQFQNNEVQVMVATAAFGMGVDKKDIRKVIHYGLPSSIEVYMQECGRAGRDGQRSECIALFTRKCRMLRERALLNDRTAFPSVGETLKSALSRLQKVDWYFRNNDKCRRAQLLEHIGEDPCAPLLSASQAAEIPLEARGFCNRNGQGHISCKSCDVCCLERRQAKREQDCREALCVLLKIALLFERQRVSATLICCIAGGYPPSSSSPLCKHPEFGLGANLGFTKPDWSVIVEAAVVHGYMQRLPVQTLAGSRHLFLHVTSLGRQRAKSSLPFPVDFDRKASLGISRVVPTRAICIRASGREPQIAETRSTCSDRHQFRASQWISTTCSDAAKKSACLVVQSRSRGAELQELRSQIIREVSEVQDAEFLKSLLATMKGRVSAEIRTRPELPAKANRHMKPPEDAPPEMRKRKLPWAVFASGAFTSSKRMRNDT